MKMLFVTIVVTDVKFVNHSMQRKMNMRETHVMDMVRDRKFLMEKIQPKNSMIG